MNGMKELIVNAREAINDALAYLHELQLEAEKGGVPVKSTARPKRRKKGKRAKAKKQASEPVKTPEIVKQEHEPPEIQAEIERERDIAGEVESGEWWDDFHQLTSKAIEMGVVAVPGQSFDDYKARVFAAAGPGPHLESADEDMQKRVRKFRAEGINPPAPAPTRRQPVQR